jgi:TonB family protein
MGLLVSWTIALASALGTSTQPSALPDGLLARPITPGSVALLVLDARSPEVQQRLGEALRDERPAVRAIAARVTAVTISRTQAATLVDLVARESDPIALREQVRALLILDSAAHEKVVGNAIARAGGEATLVLAEFIARSRGVAIVDLLPELLERSRDVTTLADILSLVAREHPGERTRLAEGVIRTGDDPLWRAYLTALDQHRIAVLGSTWQTALVASAPAIQTTTLFALATMLENKEGLSSSVLDAALPANPWPPASPTDADFARELIARIRGSRPSDANWAAVVTRLGGRLPFALWSRLTSAEKDAARAGGFGRDERGTGAGYDPPKRSTADAAGRPARILQPIVPDLLTEMAGITDCRLRHDTDYAAAQLTYRPDGRPLQVSLVKRSIPGKCGPFVSAAMSLLVARADHVVNEFPTDIVFLPLQSDMLACVDRSATRRPVEVSEKGVTMPQVTKDKPPNYTPDAMKARAEGEVIVRAIVSDSGCVAHAEVTRPLHPELDLEALNAILQWRFRPAQLEGKSVPVLISVGVSFKLRR